MKPVRYLLPLFCLAASHIFAAPVTTGPQKAPAAGGLRVAVASAPRQLDPALAADATSARLLQLTHPALLQYDENAMPAGNVATGCTQPEPTAVVCTLPAGLADTDGEPYTAAHAAEWLEHIRHNPVSPLNGLLSDVTEITARGNTLYISLAKPSLAMLPGLAQIPMANLQTGTGMGPYRLVRQDALGTTVLETAKPGLPNPLTLVPVNDATTRLLKLERGEVDVLYNDLPPELIPYAEKKGFTTTSTPGTSYAYLLLNWRDTLLNQYPVRKALALGIDRERLRQTILAGLAEPAETLLPPNHPAAWAAPEEPYDPISAGLLLEESAMLMADATGTRTEMTLTISTDPTSQRIAQAIQQQLGQIGIRLGLRPLEWASFFEAVRNGETQLALLSWTGEQTPSFYYQVFNSSQTPPAGFNRGGVDDPQLSELTRALMDTQDPARQQTLAIAVQQRQAAVLPYIPLYRRHHTLVMGKGVAGCTIPPSGALTGLFTCRKQPS